MAKKRGNMRTLPPIAKTKANPPGGNASYERFGKGGKTKKPKVRGRRTIGDRYGLTI